MRSYNILIYLKKSIRPSKKRRIVNEILFRKRHKQNVVIKDDELSY